MRIKKREIVGKAKTNGIFLIPIFIFIFLFANVNFVSASIPANSLGIFYNFSFPNGFNGTQLIYNGGIGANGVPIYINGTLVNPLNSTLSINEVIPYSTGSRLVNAFECNKTSTHTYLDTNEFGGIAGAGLNLNDSFSFSTWMQTRNLKTTGVSPTSVNSIASYDGGTGAGAFQWNFTHNSTDVSGTFNSSLTLSVTHVGSGTLSCTYVKNADALSDYHQYGFIYNGSALTGGNIMQLFVNGEPVRNCTNGGVLTGSVNANTSAHILINQGEGANDFTVFQTDIAYWNYNVGLGTMVNAYNGTQSYFQGQPPILLQGTPFPDAPYIIGSGSKTLNLNNYFAGYTSINTRWTEILPNGTAIAYNINKSISDTNITTVTNSIRVQAQGIGSDIILTITANNRSFNGQFNLDAMNSQGQITGTFALNSNIGSGIAGSGSGVSSGDFFGIYPDSSTLTLGARVEYIVITFFAIALLFIGGLGVLFSENKRNVGDGASLGSYLTILFCLIFFIYFVTIGYITIGMLIVITLIALILCYILFVHRGRTGGT